MDWITTYLINLRTKGHLMPLSSSCRNCGQSKTPAYYSENFCADCTEAIQSARKAAESENSDPGQAQRRALAERAHSTHRGRANPLDPWGRAATLVPGVPDGPPPTN